MHCKSSNQHPGHFFHFTRWRGVVNSKGALILLLFSFFFFCNFLLQHEISFSVNLNWNVILIRRIIIMVMMMSNSGSPQIIPWDNNWLVGACNFTIFPSRRFHSPIYFRSNLPGIRLPWECHAQSRETNLRYCITGPELPFFHKGNGNNNNNLFIPSAYLYMTMIKGTFLHVKYER